MAVSSTDSKKSYDDMSADELRKEMDKLEEENVYQERGEGEGCEEYRRMSEQERLREKIIMDDIRFRMLRPKRRCKTCEGDGRDKDGRRCEQCDGRGYPRDAARRQESQREPEPEEACFTGVHNQWTSGGDSACYTIQSGFCYDDHDFEQCLAASARYEITYFKPMTLDAKPTKCAGARVLLYNRYGLLVHAIDWSKRPEHPEREAWKTLDEYNQRVHTLMTKRIVAD